MKVKKIIIPLLVVFIVSLTIIYLVIIPYHGVEAYIVNKKQPVIKFKTVGLAFVFIHNISLYSEDEILLKVKDKLNENIYPQKCTNIELDLSKYDNVFEELTRNNKILIKVYCVSDLPSDIDVFVFTCENDYYSVKRLSSHYRPWW